MKASRLALAAVLTVAVAVAACTRNDVPTYQVVDSGVYAWNHERPYWLDEHRVMFVGYAGRPPTSRDEALAMTPSIYVWDTAADRVKLYRENARRLCVADDYIRYSVPTRRDDGGLSYELKGWYEGTIGEERYTAGRDPKALDQAKSFNPITCRYQPVPEAVSGATWKALRPEHGYIIFHYRFGPRAFEDMPAQLQTAEGDLVSLPLSDPTLSTAEYSPSRNAYLLAKVASCTMFNGKGRCDAIWWLEPNGVVRTIEVPDGPWSPTGSIRYFPTRNGVALVSDRFSSVADAGVAGIYHLTGNSFNKLETGKIRSLGLSPSGCQMAYDHSRSPLPASSAKIHWFTLKRLDLCTGQR